MKDSYVAFLSIIAAVGSKFVVNDLADNCADFLDNDIAKLVVIFAIIELAVQDWQKSILGSIMVFAIVLGARYRRNGPGHREGRHIPFSNFGPSSGGGGCPGTCGV